MRKVLIPIRNSSFSTILLLLSLLALSACKTSGNQASAAAVVAPKDTANQPNPTASSGLMMIAVIEQPFVVNTTSFGLSDEHHIVQIDGLPNWLRYDPSLEELHGSPTNADAGVYDSLVLTTVDHLGLFQSHHLSVEVAAISDFSAEFSWWAPTQRTDDSALTNLAGFKIYAGRNQHTMQEWVTIPNPTVDQYTIENLGSGTWWFALSAFDTYGAESDKSAAVSRQFN